MDGARTLRRRSRKSSRAGSVPTVFAVSVSVTARLRLISRSLRRRFPGDPVVVRLERLVQRGRQGVYNAPSSRTGVLEFFANGYWRRVRERKVIPRDLVPLSRGADAARWLLGVARSGPGERPRAEPVPIGDATAHARSESRAHRRSRVGDGFADLHEQHRRDVLRVRGRAVARARHVVRVVAERRDARCRRRAWRSAPATAVRSSSS